jgi:asparagine synthase (glutamine-hydrolysing)
MSAIGAILNFNGAPLIPEAINALSEDLTDRGPDGTYQFISGNVGVCYGAFHTTKESWQERQPVVSPEGDILVMDGIVFNREELLDLLADDLGEDRTDVGLVSVGLQNYGTGFLSKIIGDFALVRYQPRTQTMLLARDPFGVRPIFYRISNDRAIVASDLRAVLSAANVPLHLDDEYVAGYLASFPEPHRTPYQNFHAVEPGYVVTVHHGKSKIDRFWTIDQNEIRYKNDKDYEERLLHELRASIKCRLRTDGRPVWSCLSGGLDSSSIVCIADELIESNQAETSQLETFSAVFSKSASADERRFITLVEQKRGRPGYHLDEDECWMCFPPTEDDFLGMPSPWHCAKGRFDRLREEMSKGGGRVLLDGQGGDHLFWNAPNPSPELTNLLAQGKIWQLYRRLDMWSKANKSPYLQLFWRSALLPLLPTKVRVRYEPKIEIPQWLDAEFVRRTNMRERLLPPGDPFGLHMPGERIQASVINQVIWLIAPGTYQDQEQVEMRFPYLHRPLIEFILAIPFEQKLRPGETRSLMRRALRGILPEKVRCRRSKGLIAETLNRGLTRERLRLDHLLKDARVCAYGYADAQALRSALRLAVHGGKVDLGALVKTISIEIWLRSLEEHACIAKGAIEHDRVPSSLAEMEDPLAAH